VQHPDSTIPAIGRPIGPGSMIFEHFWADTVFEVGPDPSGFHAGARPGGRIRARRRSVYKGDCLHGV